MTKKRIKEIYDLLTEYDLFEKPVSQKLMNKLGVSNSELAELKSLQLLVVTLDAIEAITDIITGGNK